MTEHLGTTVRTLQRWDNEGILKAQRTPTNRRYYIEEQYLDYIDRHKKIASMLHMFGYRPTVKKMI